MVAVLVIVVLVPSVILHEVAHAFVADALGDDTARRLGRVSLNPLRHIDPIGTLLVPIVMVALTPFVIAWAKPVPVLPSRLRSPRRHSLMVALAGPFTNFALAGLAIGVFQVVRPVRDSMLWGTLALATIVNVVLGIFNLLPIPPLDGSAIIEFLLPRRVLHTWYRFRPYSIVLVVALLLLGRDKLEPVSQWAFDIWNYQQ
ncbi:MAG: Zn-dependent protease [Candidatus Poriferisodalaceae bacterium]|jgi:Zn-dependent protease